jgi:quercetin dioxygenase-like cupin family protein
MIVQEIQEKLITATKPVARLYHKSGECKTIFIGFKQGMTLEQHKTHLPARLMVITGSVTYIQADEKTVLNTYQYKDIPVNIIHEVYADEDSLCMLIQG